MKEQRLTFRLPRMLLHRRALLIPVVVLFVAALESIGRQIPSDIGDAGCLAATMLFGICCWTIWRGSLSAAVVSRQLKQLLEVLKERLPKRGYDLRDSPPLPHGMPRSTIAWTAGLVLAAAALGGLAPYFPLQLRSLLAGHVYTLYLLLLGGLWTAMSLIGTMAVFAVLGDLYDTFAARFPEQQPRSMRPWAVVQLLLMMSFAAAVALLPLSAALVSLISVGAATLLVTLLTPRSRPRLVFRDEHDCPCSAPLWAMNCAAFARMLAIGVVLIVISGGSRLVDPHAGLDGPMPLTLFLSTLFAWSVVGFALVIFRLQAVVSWNGMKLDRPQPLALHVSGVADAEERAIWEAEIKRIGLRGQFAPQSPDVLEVCIVADRDAPPLHPLDVIEWPLALGVEHLADGETRFRLRRRDQVQKRRQLLRGLSRLFKHAARHKYEEGSGYFIGLHLWYVLGLVRDEPETHLYDRYDTMLHDIIGPPYWKVFPVAVRQHFRDVCEALEIDLIYLEDSVPYRRFVRVLRMMFEVYDMHAGKQPAQEMHFTGLPGVRVIIHDLAPETEQDFQQYPEPEYDDISRARVLHVFKDRGEMEATDDIPFDFSDVPEPVGVLS